MNGRSILECCYNRYIHRTLFSSKKINEQLCFDIPGEDSEVSLEFRYPRRKLDVKGDDNSEAFEMEKTQG